MTKEEFEKLDRLGEEERDAEVCKQMQDDIHAEFVYLYNEIIDFCEENQLEPDPVIQIITRKMSSKRSRQIKKDGYISKVEE